MRAKRMMPPRSNSCASARRSDGILCARRTRRSRVGPLAGDVADRHRHIILTIELTGRGLACHLHGQSRHRARASPRSAICSRSRTRTRSRSCVSQRRGDHRASPRSRRDARPGGTAGACRASARTSPRRSASCVDTGGIAVSPGAAAGVSADDPRSAAPAGRRPEDGGPALSPAGHPHARRARSRRARRPHPQLKGMGARKEGADAARRSRSARSVAGPAPDAPRPTTPRPRSSAALREAAPARRSRWSGACDAAARRAATSTSSPPARRPTLMDAFTGYRLVERVLAHGDDQVERPALGRLAGRPAPGAGRVAAARRCSTSPARRPTTSHCAIAPSGAASSSTSTACSASTTARSWPARPRQGIYEALGTRVHSAGAAREPRRDRGRRSRHAAAAGRARGPARRPAHAHHGDRRPGRPSRPWRGRRATPGSSTSPSPITARRWRWPTASTSARALAHAGASPRVQRAASTASPARRHRVRHPRRRPMDLADDCLAAARLRRSPRCTRRSTRTRSR